MSTQLKLIRIDKIKWWIVEDKVGVRTATPLCPQHNMRLSPVGHYSYNTVLRKQVLNSGDKAIKLRCEDGPHEFDLARTFGDEKQYVINKNDARIFADMPVLNLDDEAIPVAKEELKDSKYWVRAKVTDSKSGARLIVWAGIKDSNKTKTELFVEPELKRLSFDQNDDHPTKVFSRVEAIFADDITASIKKGSKK